jgi:uncharacterized protein (TIGR02301 family)
MLLKLAASICIALTLATAAGAAERTAEDRQTLTDLAYVLGQSHALRQACQGQTDQFWRDRMYSLIHTEQPDQGFERRLKDSFNTGYAAAQAAYPACTPSSRRAEARAAERGRALAEGLTGEP